MAAESLARHTEMSRRLAQEAGSRARLEAARDHLVERLTRRSDDIEASLALELVTEALSFLPPVEDFVAVEGFSPSWGDEEA
jgi:hypothetical protein